MSPRVSRAWALFSRVALPHGCRVPAPRHCPRARSVFIEADGREELESTPVPSSGRRGPRAMLRLPVINHPVCIFSWFRGWGLSVAFPNSRRAPCE